MTRMLLLTVLLVAGGSATAQERAITTSGRAVILYPDGTWKYAPSAEPGDTSVHARPSSATAKIDLARGKASLYYDPAKWVPQPSNEPGRSELAHVTGDGYAVVIAERIEMTLAALRELALSNARSAAPDAAIVWEEERVVNGLRVLALQLNGSMQGISFVYLGYYYAGPEGTFQVLTYTATNLFEEYRPDFQELLDGFVLTP